MKIILTASEVEEAIIIYMASVRSIKVMPSEIKWTEGMIHPVYPITIEVKG